MCSLFAAVDLIERKSSWYLNNVSDHFAKFWIESRTIALCFRKIDSIRNAYVKRLLFYSLVVATVPHFRLSSTMNRPTCQWQYSKIMLMKEWNFSKCFRFVIWNRVFGCYCVSRCGTRHEAQRATTAQFYDLLTDTMHSMSLLYYSAGRFTIYFENNFIF